MTSLITNSATVSARRGLRTLCAGSLVLLAILIAAPAFAATTKTTTTTTSPAPVADTDATTTTTTTTTHRHHRHHAQHKTAAAKPAHHRHHRMVARKDSVTVYTPVVGNNDYARRQELWHQHYVIEAERQSLKIACMNVKGQERSECEEKWQDVHAQQEHLVAEIAALDAHAVQPMNRDCMPPRPGMPPVPHCAPGHDGHEPHMMMGTMPRPSAIAVPPITTPDAVMVR